MDQGIESYIEQLFIPYQGHIEKLAQDLRKYFRTGTKAKYELIFESTRSINIGYGYKRKAWDCFAGIIVYSKHINISFPSGTKLYDPKNILVGKGSRIRHIRINNLDEIIQADNSALIFQARDLALDDLEESFSFDPKKHPITKVKMDSVR